MRFRNEMLAIIASTALTLGLASPARPVSAATGCHTVKGTESVVNNGDGTASGTITRGGKLNGTALTVFTSDFTATPDPNTYSFTDDLTLTTRDGTLQTHNVTLLDRANGVFSAIARIDPIASTGSFAGATGVLYINGSTTDGGATFQAKIAGTVCFAD